MNESINGWWWLVPHHKEEEGGGEESDDRHEQGDTDALQWRIMMRRMGMVVSLWQ